PLVRRSPIVLPVASGRSRMSLIGNPISVRARARPAAPAGYHAPERSVQGLLGVSLGAFLGALLGALLGTLLGATFGITISATLGVALGVAVGATLGITLIVTLGRSWRLRDLRKRHGTVGEGAQIGDHVGALAVALDARKRHGRARDIATRISEKLVEL